MVQVMINPRWRCLVPEAMRSDKLLQYFSLNPFKPKRFFFINLLINQLIRLVVLLMIKKKLVY